MPEGEPQQQQAEIKAEPNEKEEQAIVETTVPEADVLEEDDDFEDFQHEVGDENAGQGLEDVEWEDNWDDEVEGENEFAKGLRAELEKNKDL